MKMKILTIITLLITGAVSVHFDKNTGPASAVHRKQNATSYTTTNSLIQALTQINWDKEELPCIKKTLTMLENVNNFTLWATWAWDSNPNPSNIFYGSMVHAGNFKQCVNPPWLKTHPQLKMQQCLANIQLTDMREKHRSNISPYESAEVFLNMTLKLGIRVNAFEWSVCLPSSCKPHTIANIVKEMFLRTHLASISNPNITVDYCYTAEREPYSLGVYVIMALSTILIITVLASTYYRKYGKINEGSRRNIDSISKSFDIINNYQSLGKENDKEVKVMNGMRFISATIVVIFHVLFIKLLLGCNNVYQLDQELSTPPTSLAHVEIVVDTFFAISGLLYIKGLLENSERQKNLFMVLLKRYLRLIGPFMVSVFYFAYVNECYDDAPIIKKFMMLETDVCKPSWIYSLFMLNNHTYVLCNVVSWSVSCDFQLTVLATIIFYLYQRNKRIGKSAFIVALVLSFVIPGILSYYFEFRAVVFNSIGRFIDEKRKSKELNYIYLGSYSRANSYLIGAAMGYIMSQFNPANYRHVISRKFSLLICAVSLILMMFNVTLGGVYIASDYRPLEEAIVCALQRGVWAINICSIIGICEYGSLPLVSKFLSLPIFTTLSRLSYGIYLIHPLVIYKKVSNTAGSMSYDFFDMIIDAMGVTVASIGFSFIMWLLVEAPLIQISQNLLKSKRTCEENNLNSTKEDKTKIK